MKLHAALFLAAVAGLAHSAAVQNPAGKKHHKPKKHYHQGGKEHAKLAAAPPLGNQIPWTGWKVSCDSFEPGYECDKAIDGNNATFWHSAYDNAKLPHQIVVDMGAVKNVNGLSAMPRQDQNNHGMIASHDVAVSTDNKNWEVVAVGTWYDGDADVRYANFETRTARYVRLRATSEVNGKPWTSLSEIKVFEAASGPTPYNGNGKWGLTIDFPTVPVAAVVDPVDGNVLVWSSYTYDDFMGTTRNRIYTSVWDPATNAVTPKVVDNVDHDMFCPGISIDGRGKLVVTGGNAAEKTSLYDFATDSWTVGPQMKVPRGYQASATLSDGRVFTIGGSWSGGQSFKNGEVYDPAAGTWTLLNGADVKPMLTKDKQGVYRSDNHAWLFGWKDGSVFQAGPSTAMNWYNTKGSGGVSPAGQRSDANGADPDSMDGDATMFDAVQGKILTVGGSPDYQDSEATAHAHIITIGNVGAQAQVKPASKGMAYRRAFHNSVALPNGQVFITGGQSYAVPFSDDKSQFTPELYDPATDTFYQQQANSIPRVYHSVGLLLPDGRVFSAGGGLCGDCKTNHFDGQIFTPQYLLTKDGQPAPRPVIRSAVQADRRITITTDSPVKTASLMRYGTSTHTVNTDQRRVPLTLVSAGTNQYTVDVPADRGVVLPGYYMLFVMNENGVPSVSKTVNFLD
ncbi:hypothetical protein E4U54_004669 [Claviceps lovelessii]|nr:hypothetical protein E4U54_004669 [Claviceps lovelessii]